MTFLASDESFLRHDWPGHPENAGRLASILARFEARPVRGVTRLAPDRGATDEELLHAHSRRVLVAVEQADAHGPTHIDPDTYVVPGSRIAALRAARLTLQAAERALSDDEGGLVLVRPPGHHATHDRSMGFCLLNNVAVAAANLLAKGSAKRILVFDHDVHHGNGTQEIFYESDRVLYQSFHLSPHYPGTGAVDETGHGAGEGFTANGPLSMGQGEPEVRALAEGVFVPMARAWKPDLILFSAGYDSLEGDALGGLRLLPAFFGELVRRFRAVTPRLVCVLEGGYQLDKIPLAAESQLLALTGARGADGDTTKEPASLAPLRRALVDWWPTLA